MEGCAHNLFDELRDPSVRLPNGKPLPPLFDFNPDGMLLLLLHYQTMPSCPFSSLAVELVNALFRRHHCKQKVEKHS